MVNKIEIRIGQLYEICLKNKVFGYDTSSCHDFNNFIGSLTYNSDIEYDKNWDNPFDSLIDGYPDAMADFISKLAFGGKQTYIIPIDYKDVFRSLEILNNYRDDFFTILRYPGMYIITTEPNLVSLLKLST